MKLLHVVPSFGLGGMEKVICAVIKHTTPAYHHSILALDNNTQAGRWLHDEKVQFLDFAKPAQRRKFFLTLADVLRNVRPDLLEAVWKQSLYKIRSYVICRTRL